MVKAIRESGKEFQLDLPMGEIIKNMKIKS